MTFLLYLLVGAIAGLLAGLFGIGGGMVIVPVLIFSFAAQGVSADVLTHMAVATSLTTIVFTSISSVREHHRNGAIDWPMVSNMALGIVVGTGVGVAFITSVPGPILQSIIGVFALLLSAKMFFAWEPSGSGVRPGRVGLVSAGGVIGFGSSWFGIGGGTFTVPYLTWMRFNMRQAVATSAACGIPIALTGAVSNMAAAWDNPLLPEWSTGFVYWPAVIGIALTSMPMAKVGARLAHRLNAGLLKKLFAVLLCVVGIRFLFF
ncbi:MAG: sulfite exporter TauE/SafE family protein [Alcanivorax sp.]|jgi:uncharacterized membrane protein YfcA|nr:MAG: hypothetical protein COA68_05615 [Oceanobacter sp.]|tara:strand:- start:5183 stop:5968 length:786 start_codon:yes stop_codon:yes gene_type:complete